MGIIEHVKLSVTSNKSQSVAKAWKACLLHLLLWLSTPYLLPQNNPFVRQQYSIMWVLIAGRSQPFYIFCIYDGYTIINVQTNKTGLLVTFSKHLLFIVYNVLKYPSYSLTSHLKSTIYSVGYQYNTNAAWCFIISYHPKHFYCPRNFSEGIVFWLHLFWFNLCKRYISRYDGSPQNFNTRCRCEIARTLSKMCIICGTVLTIVLEKRCIYKIGVFQDYGLFNMNIKQLQQLYIALLNMSEHISLQCIRK